jgi:hypothetical protein
MAKGNIRLSFTKVLAEKRRESVSGTVSSELAGTLHAFRGTVVEDHEMIFGTASESLPGLGHHAVSVDVSVKGKRYLVTVEEVWQKVTGAGPSGMEASKEPREVTVDFGTLDEFFSEAWNVFEGGESRAELEGIDQELLGQAMREAGLAIMDLLIANGAAYLNHLA